jgi:hypothetical protein
MDARWVSIINSFDNLKRNQIAFFLLMVRIQKMAASGMLAAI